MRRSVVYFTSFNIFFKGSILKSIKTGIAIPINLAKEFESIMKALGYSSRSKAIRDAIQLFITIHKWSSTTGEVAGAILTLYDHEELGVEERLTDIQHEYLDIIASTMHVHLTRNLCMQIIAIKGDVSRVKALYQGVVGIKGVKYVQPALFSVHISPS